MAFRILIVVGRQRFGFARLRDALNALLVNRLPEVEIFTTGGPGAPSLAACYAAERKLKLTTISLDYGTHRGDAEEWRNDRLVELADAAVLVGSVIEVRDLLARVATKGLGIVTVGGAVGEKRRERACGRRRRNRNGSGAAGLSQRASLCQTIAGSCRMC